MRGPGLRYRGWGIWPVFPRVIAGRWPWRLSGDQAGFLAVAPDDVRDVGERVGQISDFSGRAGLVPSAP